MDNQKKIDDIVAMLDRFVLNGGGHMNIEVNEELNLTTEEVNVETYQSLDCGKGNMACAVPTIHKGFDDEGND